MKKYKKKLLTTSILITMSTIVMHIINRVVSASAVIKNLLPSRKKIFTSGALEMFLY